MIRVNISPKTLHQGYIQPIGHHRQAGAVVFRSIFSTQRSWRFVYWGNPATKHQRRRFPAPASRAIFVTKVVFSSEVDGILGDLNNFRSY